MPRRRSIRLLFLTAAALLASSHAPGAPSSTHPRFLSFEARVEAQRAIEQVWWSHRIWPAENPAPKPALEAGISDDRMREIVADYLKKSNVLDHLWGRPITAEQLQSELARMAGTTRDAATLRELFAALGDDPFLIAETLVRPALVDGLIRSAYARDDRFHAATRRRAERALEGVRDPEDLKTTGAAYAELVLTLGPTSVAPAALGRHEVVVERDEWESRVAELARSFGARPDSAALPRMQVGPLTETDDAFEVSAVLDRDAGFVRIATATWRKLPFETWWASQHESTELDVEPVAGAFSPVAIAAASPCVSGTWTPTTITGAPFRRVLHTAVWTGAEMIVWGGWESTGGRYAPATNSWIATSLASVPEGTLYNTAVWTGTEMIVWGGQGDIVGEFRTGGRYNPATNTWVATSTTGAPTARARHSAVWTGSEMIVWGGMNTCSGSCHTDLDSGGRYNPSTNSWSPTTLIQAPAARLWHTAVWTGSDMLVWGGAFYSDGTYVALASGGRYNPSSNSWTATSSSNAPSARFHHTAVWTGGSMIVWGGGGIGYVLTNTGARYDGASNSWTAIPTAQAPSARWDHTGVWTGSEMIVWGGSGSLAYLGDGGRFDPAVNAWTATSQIGVPSARTVHSAVWADSEMIVWGGREGGGGATTSGARYCGTPCTAPATWYQDLDGDGYGTAAAVRQACDHQQGFATASGDCNDSNTAIHPGAAEICNGADEDCDGQIDDDAQGEDSDADGLHNVCDNCPGAYNPSQVDTDQDGPGDPCDNCPLEYDPTQSDGDHDGRGDFCDNCPSSFNASQVNSDADVPGDACDNCPLVTNAQQTDGDLDGSGDACDNCPGDPNQSQSDYDNDHEGDVCDWTDGLILIFSTDKNYVEWQLESGPTAWNVYEGDLDVLRQTGVYTQIEGSNPLALRFCGVVDPWVDDLVNPPAGKVKFALVTGVQLGSEWSLGEDSRQVERPNTHPCP